MAGRRHYTKVVMPLQPPVIDRRVSQIVKGEVSIPARLQAGLKTVFMAPIYRPA